MWKITATTWSGGCWIFADLPKAEVSWKKAFLVVNFQLQLLGCVYEGRNKQGKVMMIVDK